MKIAIVMPTISGREEMCEQMKQYYRDRTPFEIEIHNPFGYPNWPSGCNAAQRAGIDADAILFTADDLEPIEGWAEAALDALSQGIVPGPLVWNHVYDGPFWNTNDGPAGKAIEFSRIPMLTPEMAERIGPWPEGFHYYSDNWVSDAARAQGYRIQTVDRYNFVHHWHPAGRLDGGDWVARDLPLYNIERIKLGLEPL